MRMQGKLRLTRGWGAAMLATALGLALGLNAQAGEIKWSGGGGSDTSWANPANWDGGKVPGASDDALFDFASGTRTVTIDSEVEINDVTISIGGAAWVFNGSGALVFSGVFAVYGGPSSSSRTIAVKLSGPGKMVYDRQNAGTDLLAGPANAGNDFSGGMELYSGSLRTASSGVNLGTGPIRLYGGHFTTADGGVKNVTNAVYFCGDVRVGWYGTTRLDGPVYFTKDLTIANGSSSGALQFYSQAPTFSGDYEVRFTGTSSPL